MKHANGQRSVRERDISIIESGDELMCFAAAKGATGAGCTDWRERERERREQRTRLGPLQRIDTASVR